MRALGVMLTECATGCARTEHFHLEPLLLRAGLEDSWLRVVQGLLVNWKLVPVRSCRV